MFCGDDRLRFEQFKHIFHRLRLQREFCSVRRQQRAQLPDRGRTIPRRFVHAVQKEFDPLLVVSAPAHLAQSVVVLHSIALEIERHIQRRRSQNAALKQHQHYQHSADATVAVQERMYRLKLIVRKRGLQQRIVFAHVDILFKVAHRDVHLIDRRRHIFRRRDRTAGGAYPILTATKLAGRFVLSSHPRHQDLMSLFEQPASERQSLHPLDGVAQRFDIVDHFVHFGIDRDVVAGIQNVLERRLRTLNLRTEQSLFAHICPQKQLDVGDKLGNRVKLPYRMTRTRYRIEHRLVNDKVWTRRQRRRTIGVVGRLTQIDFDILSGSVHCISLILCFIDCFSYILNYTLILIFVNILK